MMRPHPISSGPTTGMLFSAWQAMTQALQPMQAALSITMAQAGSARWLGGRSDGWLSWFLSRFAEGSPAKVRTGNRSFVAASSRVTAVVIARSSLFGSFSILTWPKTQGAPDSRMAKAFTPTPVPIVPG